jgi:hypothetical protein
MQTYSHFIIAAVLNRNLRQSRTQDALELQPPRLPPLRSFPLLLGSVAPDLPLIAITLIFVARDRLAGNVWDMANPGQSYVGRLFDDMFFNTPWVIAAHNLMHAPFMVIGAAAVGYWAWQRGRGWGAWLFWFGLSCLLHTAIDIPLHYDDGPLLLFPFNWEVRFHSPVSYWDPARYGTPFTIFEHLLVLGMLIYLGWMWWRDRQARRA